MVRSSVGSLHLGLSVERKPSLVIEKDSADIRKLVEGPQRFILCSSVFSYCHHCGNRQTPGGSGGSRCESRHLTKTRHS